MVVTDIKQAASLSTQRSEKFPWAAEGEPEVQGEDAGEELPWPELQEA